MHANPRAIAGGILFAGTVAGIAYTVFAISRLRSFERRVARAPRSQNIGITILKPLHGDEPGLYENLRSFCDQDYGDFRVVFGAANANDPALAVARRLRAEFPHRDIAIAAGEPGRARNPKVANLLGMERYIDRPLVVIADSDMQVGRDYLQVLSGVFDDEQTAAATCVFSGTPNGSIASKIGALAITDEFNPSVLVAEALGPVNFSMGATVAVRRAVFEEIGGFEAIADHLADDYEIGRRTAALGQRVVIAPYPVTTAVPETSLAHVWHHEVRWARTVFLARPAGYAGSIITNAPALSLLAILVRGPRPAYLMLAAAAFAARTWLHFEAGRVLARNIRTVPYLLPVRVVLSVGVWGAAFLGRRVGWRGTALSVDAEGRLLDGPSAV